jgi:hypothetical protein
MSLLILLGAMLAIIFISLALYTSISKRSHTRWLQQSEKDAYELKDYDSFWRSAAHKEQFLTIREGVIIRARIECFKYPKLEYPVYSGKVSSIGSSYPLYIKIKLDDGNYRYLSLGEWMTEYWIISDDNQES